MRQTLVRDMVELVRGDRSPERLAGDPLIQRWYSVYMSTYLLLGHMPHDSTA